jgi:3-deoxy-D-manno-octulosonic acid (KDO) 8-phosphate synthase
VTNGVVVDVARERADIILLSLLPFGANAGGKSIAEVRRFLAEWFRSEDALYGKVKGGAEYVISGGNDRVIVCERGIRAYETYTRNTLDLNAVAVAKSISHLPVIVDPSHAAGVRDKVVPLARAAIATGADGLLVEVHHDPERAICDGPQSLFPHQFEALAAQIRLIAEAVGRSL